MAVAMARTLRAEDFSGTGALGAVEKARTVRAVEFAGTGAVRAVEVVRTVISVCKVCIYSLLSVHKAVVRHIEINDISSYLVT